MKESKKKIPLRFSRKLTNRVKILYTFETDINNNRVWKTIYIVKCDFYKKTLLRCKKKREKRAPWECIILIHIYVMSIVH